MLHTVAPLLLLFTLCSAQVAFVGYSGNDATCTTPLLAGFYPSTCSAFTGGMSYTYAYGVCRTDGTPQLVANCGNSSCIGGSCQTTTLSPACFQYFPNIYYNKFTCAGEGSRVRPDIQYTAYSDLTCTVAQQQFNQTKGCFSKYFYRCSADGNTVFVDNTNTDDCSGRISTFNLALGQCVRDPVTSNYVKFTKCSTSAGVQHVLSIGFILLLVLLSINL